MVQRATRRPDFLVLRTTEPTESAAIVRHFFCHFVAGVSTRWPPLMLQELPVMAKVCDQLHSTTNLGKLDSMSDNIKKYGPAQAAEQLGIHADTLRRWEKEGTIT